MRETREQLFQRIRNEPAFEYVVERVIIALSPIFEEIADLEDRLRKAKTLARLTDEDLKRQDDDIDLDYASTIADELVALTSVDEVRALIKQHGGKSLSKLKTKQLIAFTREVQYKISYIKTMSDRNT